MGRRLAYYSWRVGRRSIQEMNTEIWHKGQLIAVIPVEHFFEMTLDDGRLLHVGAFGIFFKQPIVPDDQIKIVTK